MFAKETVVRILGIDPGLTRCGIGVVDIDVNRRMTFVDVTVARTDSADELPARLHSLHDQLVTLIDTYQPDVVSLERVFSQLNVSTAMGTAQASAVAMLIASQRGIPTHMYTPTEVKAAVTGYGRADKAQITAMVTRLLNLSSAPKPADAADALALAMCHAMRGLSSHKRATELARSTS